MIERASTQISEVNDDVFLHKHFYQSLTSSLVLFYLPGYDAVWHKGRRLQRLLFFKTRFRGPNSAELLF